MRGGEGTAVAHSWLYYVALRICKIERDREREMKRLRERGLEFLIPQTEYLCVEKKVQFYPSKSHKRHFNDSYNSHVNTRT